MKLDFVSCVDMVFEMDHWIIDLSSKIRRAAKQVRLVHGQILG